MSSRICRLEDAEAAQPIEWRALGTTPAPAPGGRAAHSKSTPGQSHDPAAEAAEAHAANREREIEAAAYQKGLAAGEAAAGQHAQVRVEAAVAGLNAVVAELAGLRRKFRAEAEEDTVILAIAIARRVLNRELASDPEALLGLVKAAFQKCNARETYKLRLSPQDAETAREHRARLNLPEAVEIAADGALLRGSAIFETSRGELDASLDTQLVEIERGLTDVMRRRNR